MSFDATSQDGKGGARPVVSLRDLVFSWDRQEPVLDIPAFDVLAGEALFVKGPSGSGKSSLLGLIGGVLQADRGQVEVLDTHLGSLSSRQRDRFRADHLGIVFQMFNLLPYLTVLENVSLACRFSARRAEATASKGGVSAEATRLLKSLGLTDAQIARPVTDLSVGQQQRVAVARALIGSPELIIADEPTSALDDAHRAQFLDLLMTECRSRKATLIFVSHESRLSTQFDRVVDLTDLNRASQGEVV